MTEPDKPRTGRSYPADIAATGAWREGDPVGNRQFFTFAEEYPFVLEVGGALRSVTAAYETWGELDADASNAILVCHALTGDSHAAGPMTVAHKSDGWWNDFVGPGLAIDTDRYFVVCVNVLGGCQGSTGPASIDPATNKPYGSSFPVVTVRDMVRVQARVGDHLGIDTWSHVVGGSMGGMQVYEWAVMYPHRVNAFTAMASTLSATAQQISWSAIGRIALSLDPKWRGGEYYDAPVGDGPHAGLAAARAVAQVTYRTDEAFQRRFGRDPLDPIDNFGLWDRFQVESYLDHHGQKLARRFDANSYLVLNRAMDLHDIGRGRGGVEKAARRIAAPSMILSISSDELYRPWQQREASQIITAAGQSCRYELIESPEGHDGFLLEHEAIGPKLAKFIADTHR